MEQRKVMRMPLSRRGFMGAGAALPLLALAGCQLPGSGAAPRRVRLQPVADFPPSLPSAGWSLLVQEPDATSALNTARIVFVKANGDIAYLATGEWSSRAPEMVMELMVESFKESGKMLSVGDRRARIRPDFELETRLADFQVEEAGADAGRVRVEIHGSLVQKPRRNVLSSFAFDSESAVAPLTLDNILAAFQSSFEEVVDQIVEWTLVTGTAV